MKRYLVLPFLIIALLVSFGLGFLAGKAQVVCPICQPEEIDFSLFWKTYHVLKERFVDKEEIDAQKMIYGAISGLVKSLDDPYTVFFPPEETKRFIEEIKGAFEGVGMEIGIRNGQLQVIAPLKGTPAERAGLRAGDKIMEIDGLSTLDITIEEAVNLIRGPRGTKVVLTIYRQEWQDSKKTEIVREVIKIPTLEWEILNDNIAYLKLYHFTESAEFDFQRAGIEILGSRAEMIILDLRNNPGGYLEVAQNIAGWFLKKGQIVAIEDFGSKKEQKIYKAQGNSRFLEYPIVVLINGGSASGSEILAGALRDNRQVILIGEKSFGKGSVQELERLGEGSSLKITVAKWLTPKGQSITDKGLEPDILVEMTEKDYDEGKDPQLDKAIEVIKELP